MAWMGFEKLISDMIPHASQVEKLAATNIRSAAGELALRTFGPDLPFQQPALVNVAALALSMRDRLIVHRVSDGAAKVVHETDLHTLPGEPPTLLRRAFVITSRSPEKGLRLFGDTVELAGYAVDDKLFLVGLNYPDGIMVAQWRPHWEERDIDVGTPWDELTGLIEDFDTWQDWGQKAGRFAVMLGGDTRCHQGREASQQTESGARAPIQRCAPLDNTKSLRGRSSVLAIVSAKPGRVRRTRPLAFARDYRYG